MLRWEIASSWGKWTLKPCGLCGLLTNHFLGKCHFEAVIERFVKLEVVRKDRRNTTPVINGWTLLIQSYPYFSHLIYLSLGLLRNHCFFQRIVTGNAKCSSLPGLPGGSSAMPQRTRIQSFEEPTVNMDFMGSFNLTNLSDDFMGI